MHASKKSSEIETLTFLLKERGKYILIYVFILFKSENIIIWLQTSLLKVVNAISPAK